MSVRLLVCPSICLFFCPSVCPSVSPSVYPWGCAKVAKNVAILRLGAVMNFGFKEGVEKARVMISGSDCMLGDLK